MAILKGAHINRFPEIGVLQMDTLKNSTANCMSLEIRAEAYNSNQMTYPLPNGTPIGYRDKVREIVQMAKDRGLKVLLYLTPRYVSSGYWGVVGRVIAYEPDQTTYINQWKTIIQELQPDAVSILNEAPDHYLAGLPETDLNWTKYKAFAIRSIDEYRSVKPNLEIHMTSYPFWDMRAVALDPIPRPNVTYAFHFYYARSGYNRAYETAYDTAATENDFLAARNFLETYVFYEPSHVEEARAKGLDLNFIFGAEPRQMNNCPRFLRDVYAICAAKGIASIFQSAYGIDTYPGGQYLAGMWNLTNTALNLVGQVWAEQMLAVIIEVRYLLNIFTVLGGTTTPTGIQAVPPGTVVTITATPAPGYTINIWQVQQETAHALTNYPGTVNPLTLTITEATTVMPLFSLVPVPPTCPAGTHWDATINACVQDTPSQNNLAAGAVIGTLVVAGVLYVASRKKR